MIPHIDGQVFVDGKFTSAKVQRVVQAIQEYEPEIIVDWDTSAEKRGVPMFRVSHQPVGQEPFVLFYVKNEDEFDERVLYRIIANDQRRGKITFSQLEAWEETQKLMARQKWLDELEVINDIAYHVFKTPLNDYKVSNDLVIKEGIPHNAAYLDEKNAKKRGSPSFDLKEFTNG